MSIDYVLAIPVFNEEKHLDRVLAEAERIGSALRTQANGPRSGPYILVVDDGSTDGTPRRLRDHRCAVQPSEVHVITHPENRGYGKSLADAFAFAQRRAFEWLITMDCDEQHEASQIPRFLAAAAEDDADIISGTRYPHGFDVDASVPADRREINRLMTALLNGRLGLNLTDAFCGFKAYRVSALRHLRITVPGYAMPMQLWVQAAQAGLRVRELAVPLIYNDPTRHFGGLLDDPAVRLRHYVQVFESELAADAVSCPGHPDLLRSNCPSPERCSTFPS